MPKTQSKYTLHYLFEGLSIHELKKVVSEIKGIIGIKPIKVLDDQNQEIKL